MSPHSPRALQTQSHPLPEHCPCQPATAGWGWGGSGSYPEVLGPHWTPVGRSWRMCRRVGGARLAQHHRAGGLWGPILPMPCSPGISSQLPWDMCQLGQSRSPKPQGELWGWGWAASPAPCVSGEDAWAGWEKSPLEASPQEMPFPGHCHPAEETSPAPVHAPPFQEDDPALCKRAVRAGRDVTRENSVFSSCQADARGVREPRHHAERSRGRQLGLFLDRDCKRMNMKRKKKKKTNLDAAVPPR